ncbi:uncharacterized protein LOC110863940 isoform X1 [Helianthus annuus]|uniref:uncharacterized protein LOC110863940 isoform X1 n=1 Tax=Helianthus annuus TaxID=4232 RepID=UPI0016530860|nr:uncharacterized protein LOC110863940 isoform X1 [Helianthus annuus]
MSFAVLMGKKRSWFGFFTRFFACKAESKDERGTKRRRWCFGILKINRHYHALETSEKEVINHVEDGKQHTMALANAMRVAAEAAVAAANAATELARLIRSPEDIQGATRITAAIKIQSFYRAHLAWKALNGLRGVVKLQAVIRAQLVRQRFLNKLKNTNRSRIHQIRVPKFDQVLSKIYKEKQSLFNQLNDRRNNQITEDSNAITTHNWLDQESSIGSNQMCRIKKLRFRHKHHTEEHNSPSFRPRMLYNSRGHYHLSPDQSDDSSLQNSPVFPAYMATTESFMAKARSLSTPRQRLSFLDGYCTHGSSSSGVPMLSSSSSFNGSMKSNIYRHIHL